MRPGPTTITHSLVTPVSFRSTLRAGLLVAAAAVLAFAASMSWWDLWMNHGWPGPPRVIHALYPGRFDGEDSYDVTGLEMLVVLFALFVPAMLALSRHRLRR